MCKFLHHSERIVFFPAVLKKKEHHSSESMKGFQGLVIAYRLLKSKLHYSSLFIKQITVKTKTSTCTAVCQSLDITKLSYCNTYLPLSCLAFSWEKKKGFIFSKKNTEFFKSKVLFSNYPLNTFLQINTATFMKYNTA